MGRLVRRTTVEVFEEHDDELDGVEAVEDEELDDDEDDDAEDDDNEDDDE